MAVYTQILEPDLRRHLLNYNLGELTAFEGIAEGVENTNYKITTTTGQYIMTLVEKRANSEELPFCISFMEYLHEHGVKSPFVARSNADEKITTFNGKPCIITEFLNGSWPKSTTPFHLRELGQTVALMHREGRIVPLRQRNNMSIAAWKILISACHDRCDEVEVGLAAFLEERLAYIEKNWPKFLPKGAVHADLFPDNVFFDGDKLSGVIDFYFSCTDTLAYDLMLTLNAWCFDTQGNLDVEKSATFLQNYHASRPLSKKEIAALSLFGQAAALRIVATRLYDWLNPIDGALVRQKDPLEHVRILRFHMGVESPAAYGIK